MTRIALLFALLAWLPFHVTAQDITTAFLRGIEEGAR
jgi:hypothetical protein